MSKATLWRVAIDDSDWDYDRFAEAVVWAESAEQAERIVRAAYRYPEEDRAKETIASIRDSKWIQDQSWRLNVTPAPTEGIALVHWHAG